MFYFPSVRLSILLFLFSSLSLLIVFASCCIFSSSSCCLKVSLGKRHDTRDRDLRDCHHTSLVRVHVSKQEKTSESVAASKRYERLVDPWQGTSWNFRRLQFSKTLENLEKVLERSRRSFEFNSNRGCKVHGKSLIVKTERSHTAWMRRGSTELFRCGSETS